MKPICILLLCVALVGCDRPDRTAANVSAPAHDVRVVQLSKTKDSLTRFYKPMVVQDGDWLESHPEDGETFEQYIQSRPTLPTAERRTIYIQPIGSFTEGERQVIRLTADYLKAFYSLPVSLSKDLPIGKVPNDLSRVLFPNNRQIRTSYFIDDALPKLLPDDAAALICFTNYDLYPGETWHYVFGQASLERRVGVWSLWRLEKESGKLVERDLFLDRTLKVAMHETGHMFSMRHCTKYECLMSGTNHLDEIDRRPLDTCPECTMKIAWAMNYSPAERFKLLAEFWRKQGREEKEKEMLEKARSVGAG